MKPNRKPAKAALSRNVLAPLLTLLLASCTSASGPQLQTAGVSHTGTAALSSVETKADAKPTAAAEGDAVPAAEAFAETGSKPLPEKVAAAPGARPESAAEAAKQEEAETKVASAEEPADQPKPQIRIGFRPAKMLLREDNYRSGLPISGMRTSRLSAL